MGIDDLKHKVQACVANLPQRGNVRKISLFGSYLHGDAKPESDVDLIIELKEAVGFFELMRIQNHLEQALKKRVDLVESEALSKYIRSEVLSEAQPLYER